MNRVKLITFLKTVCMGKEIEVAECILDVTKDKISTRAITGQNNVVIIGSLKNEIKEKLGKLGIDNLPNLIKYLECIDAKEIDLKKVDNYLQISSKSKKVKNILREIEYIPQVEKEKVDKLLKLAKGDTFTLNYETLLKIKRNTELLAVNEFTLKSDGTKLEYTGGNFDKIEEKYDVKIPEFEVTLSRYFLDALVGVKGDIKISIKKDVPIYVSYKTENMDIEWIIAPVGKKQEN